MEVHAAIASLRRSELLDDAPERERIVSEATRELEEEGVRSPWEFAAVFATSSVDRDHRGKADK
jgi:hypothetical protein